MAQAGLLCLCPSDILGNLGEKGISEEPFELYKPDIIPVPDNPKEWAKFRKSLHIWKQKAQKELKYNDSLYNNTDFKWASSAYNCYFLMMYDEAFYNVETGQYTVDHFLDNTIKDFGRLDIVVLWHAYPRIGLDDRNQFDFYRDMPGGLEGIRKVSTHLHEKGIKVFINYNPWDTGTRRENISDLEALADMVKAIDADGIFLDTMTNASADFRKQLDSVRPGVALESEHALPVENIPDHHLSWAQWFQDSKAPGILRNKWYEHRHIQHGISRWSKDKSSILHTAWMNGGGVMIWENVFGQWLEWSDRDKFILRAISPIQKRYTDIFSTGEWIPMADTKPIENIYTNLWEKDSVRLWTLVNRSENTIEGNLVHIDIKSGERYFDLIQGIEIKPEKAKGILNGKIIPRGVGCFIAIKKQVINNDFINFLKSQQIIYKGLSVNTDFNIKQTSLKPITNTKRYVGIPDEMVGIPAFKGVQEVVFRVREIGYYDSFDKSFEDVVYPGLHFLVTKTKEVDIACFAIDETPVTNKQFEYFLKESGYSPADKTNFLKHWINGEVPSGKEVHPVVYIDLEDARAYARWVGKRLPKEEEWQFAAQGKGNLKYPWGNELDESKCNAGQSGDTTPVNQYPQGKSSFGCYDMCGNVWELTESERSDGRNRFCILKGGSYYQAQGSEWYFDGGVQPVDFAAKQLLMYPGVDRCSTIGFRCVVDLD